MGYKLVSYPDAAALAQGAAADWLAELDRKSKGHEADEPYSVALSGGRIVHDFFSQVAAQTIQRKKESNFKNVHFFWADERCVPPDDAESNYKIAQELLFGPLKIAADQVHRLRGELDPAAALREAEETLKSVVPPKAGKGLPVLDMVFLGMGEDGHVASLFPGESADVMANPAIFRAVTAVKPPPRRLTLGYGMLDAATQVWAVVSGNGKEQALKESLSPQGKTPLARVIRSRGKLETKILADIRVNLA